MTAIRPPHVRLERAPGGGLSPTRRVLVVLAAVALEAPLLLKLLGLGG